MGSALIFNDTLNLTFDQGFPVELNLETHRNTPYNAEAFKDCLFSFHKPQLRFYHPQPNRVWLVQNIDGRWVYWGMAHVQNVTLDYVAHTTSGQYTIVDIFEYANMPFVFAIRDQRPEFDFFAVQ